MEPKKNVFIRKSNVKIEPTNLILKDVQATNYAPPFEASECSSTPKQLGQFVLVKNGRSKIGKSWMHCPEKH